MVDGMLESELFFYDRSERFIESMKDAEEAEKIFGQIDYVKDKLYECLSICKGHDDLNDPYI